MKKLFLSFVIFTVSFSLSAQIGDTRLWEVKHPNQSHSSYLIGTVHSGYEGVFDINDSIYWAIDQSDLLSVELDNNEMNYSNTISMKSMSMDMAYLMMECVAEILPDYKKVSIDTLVKVYTDGISQFYDQDGTTEETSESRSLVFDYFLVAYARFHKKEVKGIETFSDQMNALFSVDKPQMEHMIRGFFSKSPRFKANMVTDSVVIMAANNRSNDICSAFKTYTEHAVWGSYYRRLLDERNEGMVAFFEEQHKEKPLSCAVGLGHMCGPNGLISLLVKNGYTIRPMNIESPYRQKKSVEWGPYENKYFTTIVPLGVDTVIKTSSYSLAAMNQFQKTKGNIFLTPKGAVFFEYKKPYSYSEESEISTAEEAVGELVTAADESLSFEESMERYINGELEKPVPEEIEVSQGIIVDAMDGVVESAVDTVTAETDENVSLEVEIDTVETDEIKPKVKKYASRFVEFWSKVNSVRKSSYLDAYSFNEEDDTQTKIDTIRLGANGYYTIQYEDDVIFEYRPSENSEIVLQIRGDENAMKDPGLLQFFRNAILKKED